MTEGRLAPEEVRTRTFSRVVRGYKRREVRRLLERAATDLARLRNGLGAGGPADQRPLTPEEVEEARFQPALGGYEMDEVDRFLDEVVAELEQAAHEPLRPPSALPAPPRPGLFPPAHGFRPPDPAEVRRRSRLAREAPPAPDPDPDLDLETGSDGRARRRPGAADGRAAAPGRRAAATFPSPASRRPLPAAQPPPVPWRRTPSRPRARTQRRRSGRTRGSSRRRRSRRRRRRRLRRPRRRRPSGPRPCRRRGRCPRRRWRRGASTGAPPATCRPTSTCSWPRRPAPWPAATGTP